MKPKLWRWQDGRQSDTKYRKFTLWYFRIWKWGFDAYILKYSPNTELKWHTDPIPNAEHWRKNIKIKGLAVFFRKHNNTMTAYVKRNSPTFRPDIEEHMLMVYNKGCIKLSFGFVRFS